MWRERKIAGNILPAAISKYTSTNTNTHHTHITSLEFVLPLLVMKKRRHITTFSDSFFFCIAKSAKEDCFLVHVAGGGTLNVDLGTVWQEKMRKADKGVLFFFFIFKRAVTEIEFSPLHHITSVNSPTLFFFFRAEMLNNC